MTPGRLKDLRRVTQAVAQARQSEMARLRREETRLRLRLAEIEADRARSLASLDPEEPATRSGAVMLWQGWVDGKRAGLNGDLAILRARMIAARQVLSEAHGRDRALAGVTDRILARTAALAQRREDNRGD